MLYSVTIVIICVGNACGLSFPKLLCLGHLKTLQTRNIKIKDLNTTNKDLKKVTIQGSRYCSVESVNSMTGDTVQLAFNYSYKFLF